MQGLRELISFTIAKGDLSQNPREEAGSDRIAALARSDPLGAALWRVVGQHDVTSLREAMRLLAARIDPNADKIRPSVMHRFCLQVLEEWLSCPCPTCGGKPFATDDKGVHVVCWECKGSGRGGRSPEDRMRMLRIGKREYAHISHLFQEAQHILTDADARVSAQIRQQLGRRDFYKIPPPSHVVG